MPRTSEEGGLEPPPPSLKGEAGQGLIQTVGTRRKGKDRRGHSVAKQGFDRFFFLYWLKLANGRIIFSKDDFSLCDVVKSK